MQVLAIYLSVYEQQAARNPQGLQQTSMLQCACFFHGHKKERQNTDGDNNEDLKQGRPAAGCLCGMQQTKGVFPVFQRVRCPGPAAGALCCTCLACCSLSTCTLLRPQEWLLNSSPSRRDRVSLADEARCRRQYCALIWEAGKRLQLCTPTCCLWPWLTGSVHPLYCKRHFACQCGMLKHKASCNSALVRLPLYQVVIQCSSTAVTVCAGSQVAPVHCDRHRVLPPLLRAALHGEQRPAGAPRSTPRSTPPASSEPA